MSKNDVRNKVSFYESMMASVIVILEFGVYLCYVVVVILHGMSGLY